LIGKGEDEKYQRIVICGGMKKTAFMEALIEMQLVKPHLKNQLIAEYDHITLFCFATPSGQLQNLCEVMQINKIDKIL
jgi:hypothetical protein